MENKYSVLHAHSSFSLLDGMSSPMENAKRAASVGVKALAITDHSNMFGHNAHIEACVKNKIKPLLGVEVNVCHNLASIKSPENRQYTHMVLFAKNHAGWKDLCKLVSKTNDPAYYYYRPRIHLLTEGEELGLDHFVKNGNIIGISGHQGSHLSDILFSDLYQADHENKKKQIKTGYGQYKECGHHSFYEQFLRKDWMEHACELATKIHKAFGGNFYVELQNEFDKTDQIPMYVQPLIIECLRKVSKQTGIKATCSSDSHYANPEDFSDHRILLYSQLKETEASIAEKMKNIEENDVFAFFGSKSFYIHSLDEMKAKFLPEELEQSNIISDQVEQFEIEVKKPFFPVFKTSLKPKEKYSSFYSICKTESDRMILSAAIDGATEYEPWNHPKWKEHKEPANKEKYWDRLKEELAVFFNAGLSDYFLLVWDVCRFADKCPSDGTFDWENNKGGISPIPRGVGRGSAAGCLLSYFLGITQVDPIYYKLSFSRFYNAGRNTKDNVRFPDIDMDFAVSSREHVIDYLKWKYGEENVAQIVAIQRIQGKAAIKDVFRARNVPGGFDLANAIAALIPSEAEIADDLQKLKEEGVESGLIEWAIGNVPGMDAYYEDYKTYIDQAIRIEGINKAQSRHPSAVVITPKPVAEIFPMAYDSRSKQKIVAHDMKTLEKQGGIKIDILGVAILDKLSLATKLANERHKPTENQPKITFASSATDRFKPKLPFVFKDVPFDDPLVWSVYQRGDTVGTFQTESKLSTDWCKAIKPQSIEDLSDVVALVRPGCLESGETKKYAERREGKEPVHFIHDSLKSVLEPTQGIFIYQEQILEAAVVLAGFTEVEADLLRVAMGKKLPEQMAKMKKLFVEKSIEKGVIDEPLALEIFDIFEKAQRYSFNKCLTENTTVVVKQKNGYRSNVGITLLKRGTKILGYGENGNKWVTVTDIISNGSQRVFKITTVYGKVIECTLNHKFLCSDGMVRTAIDIFSGRYSFVCTDDFFGDRLLVDESIEKIEHLGIRPTYDITVDSKEHLYYANGIVTHNSHSCSYALTSYFSAYVKHHFPTEFYCAWLTYSSEKPEPKEEVRRLVINAKSNGVYVSPPDISLKNTDFAIVKDRHIAFGLAHIRGLGPSAIEKVNNVKMGDSWLSFLKVIPKIKRNVAQALIKSGALDSKYKMPRSEMIRQVQMIYGYSDKKAESTNDVYRALTDKELTCFLDNLSEDTGLAGAFQSILDEKQCVAKRRPVIEAKIAGLPNVKEDSNRQNSIWEKILLGVSLSCSAVDDFEFSNDPRFKTCQQLLRAPKRKHGETFSVHACIDKIEEKKTGPKSKNPGQEYAYLTIGDGTATLENVICWAEAYGQYKDLIVEDEVVTFNLKRVFWNQKEQIVVQSIESLTEEEEVNVETQGSVDQ
jgi:DNA-directed DNA polymerase III PolC